jgi:hypothetical protein
MRRIRDSALVLVVLSLLVLLALLGASCNQAPKKTASADNLTIGASMGQDADALFDELEGSDDNDTI